MPEKDTRIDPRDTLKLLDKLSELGFDDEAFWRLHHFRDRKHETINSFRRFCKSIQAFQRDGNNQRVHERLDFVLMHHKTENVSSGRTKIFSDLAEAAFEKIPKK